MRQFHTTLFLAVARFLQTAEIKTMLPQKRNFWRPYVAGGGAERISQTSKTSGETALARFEADCVELELVASLATIGKIRELYSKPDADYRTLGPLAEELNGRLLDEMQGRYFFALSMRESEYYSKPRRNWEEVSHRFPDSVSDIEEASKCFALSRYAAAVFHTLQVIEFGLIELGTFIKVVDPKSGWTAVSNKLKQIVEKPHANRTDFERENYPFLEQVQGTVEALKNAWRNKISHAQGQLILLGKDFSPEIAEEILFATRAFMRRLADGLPSVVV